MPPWERRVVRPKPNGGSRALVVVVPRPCVPCRRLQGHALTFEVTRGSSPSVKAFAGVLQFSAPENTVVLPLALVSALALTPDDAVELRMVELPRGTYARLEPLDASFVKVPDYRYVRTPVYASAEWSGGGGGGGRAPPTTCDGGCPPLPPSSPVSPHVYASTRQRPPGPYSRRRCVRSTRHSRRDRSSPSAS